MAVTSSYCPGCGTARPEGAQFCPSCGRAFDPAVSPTVAPPGPGFEPALARTVIAVQNLNIKVGVGKLIGMIAALGVWYVLIVPMTYSQPLPVVIALPVAVFAGIFIGGRLTLWALSQ